MMFVIVAFGLAAGSFVNALVWRLKHNKPIGGKARSQCPRCHHKLAGRDLVPLLSFMVLNGKCRYCHKKISWQYPVVEFLTAVVWLGSYLVADPLGYIRWLELAVWLILVAILIALAIYDLRWYELPDKLTRKLIYGSTIWIAVQVILNDDFALIPDAVAGMALAGGGFYLLHTVSGGRWIGGGDVKYGLFMGLWLGLQSTVVGLVVAFYSATGVALGLMLLGKKGRKDQLPFGPFLIVGTIVAYWFGAELAEYYRNFVGL